jgi:aspartyl-tRNA(Asn)/glutamyl-tRNA(Gln) amidotransferase subunit A
MMSSALEIRDAIRTGRASSLEVCQATLTRIEALNPSLNAFRTVDAEAVLKRAADLDARRSEDAHLPLFGVPVALKDNMCTRAMPTTAGSRILDGYTPP